MAPRRRTQAALAASPAPAPAPDPAPIALAPAAPAAAPARARRLPPRRVSAEVVRAETRLLDLDRRRRQSLEHHERVWADKRAALLASLPADVLAALVAMRIVDAPQTNGAAAPSAPEATTPVPAAPAAAPAESSQAAEPPVDVDRLAQMLGELDEAWGDTVARTLIDTWPEERRREVYVWADAVLSNGPMRIQARRPACTVITRQPGEEG